MVSEAVEPRRSRGLLTSDPGDLARRTVRAWELFIATAQQADPDGPTRSTGRTAKQVMIPLGSWPGSRGVERLLADAHAGATTCEPFKAAGERLVAAHGDATPAQVIASLELSLAQTRDWVMSEDLRHGGQLATPSPLGPLPVGTVVHAAAYQLAVAARDLMPAGAPANPELDEIGLVALLDATGAVAARIGLVAQASAVGRRTAVSCDIFEGGWDTVHGDNPAFPGVIGPEEVLVDLAGGRADFGALATQLRFRDGRGLLALSPVVDAIPDLPGGPLLKRSAQLARMFGRRR